MNRTVFGMPLWLVLLAVAGGGGYYLYDQRKKQAAAQASAAAASAQASAANTAAGSSSAAGTPTSMDPQLVAYQAGEASGVSAYSAGVTTGISLVDSIMSLFPGGATEQTQANQAATTAATPTANPAGVNTPQVGKSPSALGYTYIPSWPQAKLYESQGIPIYIGEPVGNGQIEFTPAPKGLAGVPSLTPLYTYTGVQGAAA